MNHPYSLLGEDVICQHDPNAVSGHSIRVQGIEGRTLHVYGVINGGCSAMVHVYDPYTHRCTEMTTDQAEALSVALGSAAWQTASRALEGGCNV